MTEGAQYVLGGMAIVAAYVGIVVDYIETQKGLDKGGKEVGPIASKVVAKWGRNALAGYTFAVAGLVTVGAAVFGTLGADYLLAFSIPLAGAYVYRDIKDTITLSKMK